MEEVTIITLVQLSGMLEEVKHVTVSIMDTLVMYWQLAWRCISHVRKSNLIPRTAIGLNCLLMDYNNMEDIKRTNKINLSYIRKIDIN